MSDRTRAAAKSADELPASAGNAQGTDSVEADASKNERLASDSDGPEIGTATDVAGADEPDCKGLKVRITAELNIGEILAEMREDFRSGADRQEAVAEAAAKAIARRLADEIGKRLSSSGCANNVPAKLNAVYVKINRQASNSDGPEIGTASDVLGILAEMREDFRGGDVAGVMVREYADRIEAAVGGKATDMAAMV